MISFNKTCFMGKERSGKTLSMVQDGHDTLLDIKTVVHDLERKKKLTQTDKKRLSLFKKFELWSNLNLNKKIYGDYKKVTVEDIYQMYKDKVVIEHKIILLDDIFKEMDSRLTGRDKNLVMSYFMAEIGKKQNVVKYVSHMTRNVEIRLRNLTEFFVWCRKGKQKEIEVSPNKILSIWIEDKDYFKLEFDEKELKRMVIRQDYFTDFVDFANDFQPGEKELVNTNYLYAYKFFNHYDTGEIV